MKGEKKITSTYAVTPSIKEKATRKAQREGLTLSEKIHNLLVEYTKSKKKTSLIVDLPSEYINTNQ